VRPPIEHDPLEKATEAYNQMISGRFRVVLTRRKFVIPSGQAARNRLSLTASTVPTRGRFLASLRQDNCGFMQLTAIPRVL